MSFELNHRSRRILHAVVSEYLTTGETVGSRRVTRRPGIDLSPATVRNVMADLEELGLLEQPHTSAGRVPTASGLRFFIDSLLKVRGLSGKEKEAIREQLRLGRGEGADFEDVIQTTSKLLSEITQYAGLVLAPNPSQDTLKHIEFIPMRAGNVLAILVSDSGQIINKIVPVEFALDTRNLERIHNYLRELLGGVSIGALRQRVLDEMGRDKNAYDQMVSAALKMSHAAVSEVGEESELFVSGQANLLTEPKGDADIQRMRELLTALEDKELLLELLDNTMASEQIQVFLGAETAPALGNASVIAVPYGPDEHPLGAIAVIGPTRMNYGKIMSVVDFTAELVSKLASER